MILCLTYNSFICNQIPPHLQNRPHIDHKTPSSPPSSLCLWSMSTSSPNSVPTSLQNSKMWLLHYYCHSNLYINWPIKTIYYSFLDASLNFSAPEGHIHPISTTLQKQMLLTHTKAQHAFSQHHDLPLQSYHLPRIKHYFLILSLLKFSSGPIKIKNHLC